MNPTEDDHSGVDTTAAIKEQTTIYSSAPARDAAFFDGVNRLCSNRSVSSSHIRSSVQYFGQRRALFSQNQRWPASILLDGFARSPAPILPDVFRNAAGAQVGR
ncbi:hypothetical protein [Bradyrhizobium retamae]|uniref:hypothetical protein n=1 Tax=Bradyrhizobium retamae TaxID=1300035 RepID=UPI0012E3D9E3|nr:hypothetical protein [Bradyrhizobium retamae]